MNVSDDNLTGGRNGTKPTIQFFETREYSQNIVFNPVDENFLFTADSKLNVLVEVNDLMAQCLTNCRYYFDYDVPEIVSQVLVGS